LAKTQNTKKVIVIEYMYIEYRIINKPHWKESIVRAICCLL